MSYRMKTPRRANKRCVSFGKYKLEIQCTEDSAKAIAELGGPSIAAVEALLALYCGALVSLKHRSRLPV